MTHKRVNLRLECVDVCVAKAFFSTLGPPRTKQDAKKLATLMPQGFDNL